MYIQVRCVFLICHSIIRSNMRNSLCVCVKVCGVCLSLLSCCQHFFLSSLALCAPLLTLITLLCLTCVSLAPPVLCIYSPAPGAPCKSVQPCLSSPLLSCSARIIGPIVFICCLLVQTLLNKRLQLFDRLFAGILRWSHAFTLREEHLKVNVKADEIARF